MEDVHMEDAGPAVRTEDKPSASSTESSGHSQDVVGSVSTELPQADSSSTSNPSLGKNLHTGRGQEPKISEQGNNTRTPATTATTTMSQGKDHVEERPTGTASVMMMMDVDPTIQSEDIKSKEENIQDTTTSKSNAAASFSSTKSQATTSFAQDANLAASGIVSTEFGIKQFESSSASMDQSATSDTQQQQVYISSSAPVSNGTADKIESASSSEDPQLKTEVPGSGSTEGAGSSTNTTTATTTTTITTPATAAAATVPPSQPVRTYIPQFKFTTFAPMTPLPTRNVTSNFLKTEKNFVLKNMARRRRRKRKVEDEDDAAAAVATQEEDKGGENMGTEDNKTEEEKEEEKKKEIENGILKRKRKDEYSAIRRGIFADEENEDDDKEDEDNDNKDENVEDSTRKKDGEDEYEDSSDSDTEEGNVNEMDENGEAKSSSDAGKKIIVIHPGSRILRIGKASDAYPVAIPHCIARRLHSTSASGTTVCNGRQPSTSLPISITQPTDASGTTVSNGEESSATEEAGEHEAHDDEDAEDDNAMEVDVHEETSDSDSLDVVNDKYLREIENDLKIRMKAAKRRPVPNAKSQVKSFNSSTEPERILDINDPYKVEWTDPVAEGEYIIGQKALNLPPSKSHTFKLFWPVVGGVLNDKDYPTPRVVAADLETIWTNVIKDDLGIEPKKFRKHYALLVIPDLYNKLYVTELVNMLLKSMQFRGVIALQESVCAAFGAGISTACVVDIGAEVTKVACVEDGVCIANSRAVLKYGGDDITRCFAALVKRTGFPYRELDLGQTYDWRLMEELKEKWCTLNEADLTVQVYNFFVRRPEKHTQKYQVKVHDEVALSPMCLFFPGVIQRRIEEREINPTFAKHNNYEDINEDAPPISLMNQSAKKNTAAAAAAVAAARAGTPAAGEDNSNPNNTNNGGTTSNVGTPGATPASTPAPSATTPAAAATASTTALTLPPPPVAAPVHHPFDMDPSVITTEKTWEIAGTIGKDNFSSLVALDVVVAQAISNCGSEERSKKLYGSIILVGGGGMIQGFDRVLEDRLFQALPATLTTVEKVEVLPSPRDMDPRLLVWKGASVLGKLESAKELWIKPLEWDLQGRKVLRDKSLFFWGKD